MGETHTPEAPKKIHGDKLAEAFRDQAGDVSKLPRHPASETTGDCRGGVSERAVADRP